jgi:hypothetical protein
MPLGGIPSHDLSVRSQFMTQSACPQNKVMDLHPAGKILIRLVEVSFNGLNFMTAYVFDDRFPWQTPDSTLQGSAQRF